jgi:hypothetical protein
MHFQKQDLGESHYMWKDDALYNGQPSRRLFDRFNGNQVLFLINFYGSLSERFSIKQGREIEHQILHHLPLDARSEISVYNWIRELIW